MNKSGPECVRCGVCCYNGTCGFGQEDEDTGICKYLIPYADGTTACHLIMTDEEVKEQMLDGYCWLRKYPYSFAEYEKLAEPLKKYLIKLFHIDWEEGDDPNNPSELGHP